MNKKNIIFLVVAIIVFLIALAIFIFANSSSNNTTPKNDTSTKLPDVSNEDSTKPKEFTFYDSENNEYKMSDFENKPIALVLWSSDSENALSILEMIDSLYDTYKDSVTFLLVNTAEPATDIIDIVQKCNFTIPIYYDTNSIASDYYTYEKLPTLIFIEDNGEVSNQIEETLSRDALLANLDIIAKNY